MVLCSTKSGSPMIRSQEPLLVRYSTIFGAINLDLKRTSTDASSSLNWPEGSEVL